MPTKTVGNQAVELLPANASRKSLAFQNEDSTDTIYIKRERSESTTVSATDHDWKLGPGGILTFNATQDGIAAITGRYTAISSANTPRIAYFETEDITR